MADPVCTPWIGLAGGACSASSLTIFRLLRLRRVRTPQTEDPLDLLLVICPETTGQRAVPLSGSGFPSNVTFWTKAGHQGYTTNMPTPSIACIGLLGRHVCDLCGTYHSASVLAELNRIILSTSPSFLHTQALQAHIWSFLTFSTLHWTFSTCGHGKRAIPPLIRIWGSCRL